MSAPSRPPPQAKGKRLPLAAVAPAEQPNLVEVDRLLRHGIQQRLFSAAACVGSHAGKPLHVGSVGSPQMPPPVGRVGLDAFFDLGELTSSLAASLGILYLAGKNRIDLSMPLARVLPITENTPLGAIAVDALLDHTSHLDDAVDLVTPLVEADRRRVGEARIVGTRRAGTEMWQQVLAQLQPKQKEGGAVYCRYNALLLGWVIAALTQKPLDEWLRENVYKPLGITTGVTFRPYPQVAERLKTERVATLKCPLRHRLLMGEVADPVAYALGGVAGHAGLFGNSNGVFRLVEALRLAYLGKNPVLHAGTLARLWTRLRRVGDSPYTLGWQSMNRHSALGQGRWHPSSVGQIDTTMGTAYLIDPSHGHVCLLLTNASHADGRPQPEAWLRLCRRVFDILVTTRLA